MFYSQRVTTDAERLARLETQMTALAAQIEAARENITEKIDGGPHVAWERSLRGRLHTLEAHDAAATAAGRALAEAQRERRLASEERHQSRTDRVLIWAKVAGVIVAAFAVALPYVLHVAG